MTAFLVFFKGGFVYDGIGKPDREITVGHIQAD